MKTLFKNLIRQSQPQNATPQVVAAKPVVSAKPNAISKPAHSENPNPQPKPSAPASPAMKIGGIGFSWNNLRNQGKPSKMKIIPGSVSAAVEQQTDAVFSQEDLELQWMAMCNRMPKELYGIATRMKNMNPVIIELPRIEVTVDNALIKQEMDDFRGRIVNTLKQSLQNANITLDIRVAEHQEQAKILSRREQFELMSKENPAIEKLRQAFDLELA